MKKVILLVLIMPYMAFGQTIESPLSGFIAPEAGKNKSDTLFMISEPGDIVISEIMADPTPVVSLPAKEYLEIHNRSEVLYNLKDWILSDGNYRSIFPEMVILPDEYIILCQVQDTGHFTIYGKTTGMKSFPALTDGGKLLYITDRGKNFVHGIEYSSSWYGDTLKDGGGWSLELVDENFPFFQKGNWKASESRNGGTPGKKNSVSAYNPDDSFDGFSNVFPEDSITLSICFPESVKIDRQHGPALQISGNQVDTIFSSDPLFRSFTAILNLPLEMGRVYQLNAGEGVKDFASNPILSNKFSFGLTEHIRPGDVMFNELLFNPFPGEPDYIELYNSSKRVINVSDLIMVSVSRETGDTSSIVFVSDENRCLVPGEYHVITTGRQQVINRFNSCEAARIFEVRSLPSMPDAGGHLILFNRNLDKIDEVSFDEDMHFPLLAGTEGIALEKIKADAPSEIAGIWYSASGSSGWGTPGASNSVITENAAAGDIITLSGTRITPDNDGNEDFLVIDLKSGENGNVVSVTVFDESGAVVKKLTDNLYSGYGGSIVWNATGIDEKPVNTGIYVLLIELFDEKGKTRKWKKVCTVLR